MFTEARDDPEMTERMAQMTEMVIQQIRRLSELHEEGILTEDEFTAKKQELLARL